MITKDEQDRLNRIRNRVDRCTPGNWRSWLGHGEIYAGGEIATNTKEEFAFVEGKVGTLVAAVNPENKNLAADKSLIVNAPEDLEFLLALVNRLVDNGLLHDADYHETNVKATRKLVRDDLDGILARLNLEPPKEELTPVGATVIGSKETARMLTENEAYKWSLTHSTNLPAGKLAHIHFHCAPQPAKGVKDTRCTYALVEVTVTNNIPALAVVFNNLPNTSGFLLEIAEEVFDFHWHDGLFKGKLPDKKKPKKQGQQRQQQQQQQRSGGDTVNFTTVDKKLVMLSSTAIELIEKRKRGEPLEKWVEEAADWWLAHADDEGYPLMTRNELVAAMRLQVNTEVNGQKLGYINVYCPSVLTDKGRMVASIDIDTPENPEKEAPKLGVIYSDLATTREELLNAAIIFTHAQIVAGRFDGHVAGRFLKERYQRQAEKRQGGGSKQGDGAPQEVQEAQEAQEQEVVSA